MFGDSEFRGALKANLFCFVILGIDLFKTNVLLVGLGMPVRTELSIFTHPENM